MHIPFSQFCGRKWRDVIVVVCGGGEGGGQIRRINFASVSAEQALSARSLSAMEIVGFCFCQSKAWVGGGGMNVVRRVCVNCTHDCVIVFIVFSENSAVLCTCHIYLSYLRPKSWTSSGQKS